MGIFDQFIDYDWFKKKKPTPAPPPEKPKEKQKVTVVKESPPPQDNFGPVASMNKLAPVQYSQVIQPREPITPEKLQAAADALGIFAKRESEPIPDFNIDDLKQKLQSFNPGELPLDLRSIGAAADTVYGTKIAQSMPDSRTRALEDLKSIRSLMGDSQALQQVQAQGRLAKYKATIDRNKPMTPEDMAHAYKFLADALGGGERSAADRAALRQAESNQATEKYNIGVENDLIKETREQQEKWAKDPNVATTRKLFEAGRRLRDGLSTGSGAGEQQAIIEYLHAIEPTSAVMKGEADAMRATAPIADRILNMKEKLLQGSSLSPTVRRDFFKLINAMEDSAEQQYRAYRQARGEALAISRIKPQDVLAPYDRTVQRDSGAFLYKMPDGSTTSVNSKELGDFMSHVIEKNIKVVPLGRRKK